MSAVNTIPADYNVKVSNNLYISLESEEEPEVVEVGPLTGKLFPCYDAIVDSAVDVQRKVPVQLTNAASVLLPPIPYTFVVRNGVKPAAKVSTLDKAEGWALIEGKPDHEFLLVFSPYRYTRTPMAKERLTDPRKMGGVGARAVFVARTYNPLDRLLAGDGRNGVYNRKRSEMMSLRISDEIQKEGYRVVVDSVDPHKMDIEVRGEGRWIAVAQVNSHFLDDSEREDTPEPHISFFGVATSVKISPPLGSVDYFAVTQSHNRWRARQGVLETIHNGTFLLSLDREQAKNALREIAWGGTGARFFYEGCAPLMTALKRAFAAVAMDDARLLFTLTKVRDIFLHPTFATQSAVSLLKTTEGDMNLGRVVPGAVVAPPTLEEKVNDIMAARAYLEGYKWLSTVHRDPAVKKELHDKATVRAFLPRDAPRHNGFIPSALVASALTTIEYDAAPTGLFFFGKAAQPHSFVYPGDADTRYVWGIGKQRWDLHNAWCAYKGYDGDEVEDEDGVVTFVHDIHDKLEPYLKNVNAVLTCGTLRNFDLCWKYATIDTFPYPILVQDLAPVPALGMTGNNPAPGQHGPIPALGMMGNIPALGLGLAGDDGGEVDVEADANPQAQVAQ